MKKFHYMFLLSSVLCLLLFRVAAQERSFVKPDNAPEEITELQPNEMGSILILEYHLIGAPEGEWRRTPENFRRDLLLLYKENYYPIRLQDYLDGKITAPRGKTPFILTFDDSSGGQFTAIRVKYGIVPEPDCAVGIMEEMKRRYPDFPVTATFFVLPGIKKELRLFAQPDLIGAKLKYLVDHGYEIGNHTLWHQNLRKASDEDVIKQLALAVKYIQDFLPGYQMRSLALPYGMQPKNKQLLLKGEYQGVKYENRAVMLVAGGPAASVFNKGFDPFCLPRIQAGDTPYGPGIWVKRMKKNPQKRFISDGSQHTITVPVSMASELSPGLKQNYRVNLTP
ncbi:MAG: polysaccharide deacetylase family protein [Bacillota bacterium]